jgi:hypothetical protein
LWCVLCVVCVSCWKGTTMADLAIAVQYARELVKEYNMPLHYACRVASWEYCVDCDRVYRVITD